MRTLSICPTFPICPLPTLAPGFNASFNSFAQDFIYAISGGQQKPPKQILLTYAIKSLTNNVDLIQLVIRCGHGVSYTQIEEIDTALCLQKMGSIANDSVNCQKILPHMLQRLWREIGLRKRSLVEEHFTEYVV